MRFHWKGLIGFFLGYYFVGDPLRQLLLTGEADVLEWPISVMDVAFSLSSMLIFFGYSCWSYATLWYWFPRKQWGWLIATFLPGLVVPIAFRYSLEEVVYLHWLGFSNYPEDVAPLYYLRDNFYFAFRYSLFGVVFYLVSLALFREKRERELVVANKETQLAHLRSQLNPHFLLNSLNNIYALVYRKSDRATEALDRLADLLRYALYEKRDLVPLSEELNHLEQLIDLQNLRFDYPVALEIEIEPDLLSHPVPQFLLVPLVENAYKHGDLKDPKVPFRLTVAQQGKHILVTAQNKPMAQQKDGQAGIGLKNIQKRLALIYPDQFSMQVTAAADQFKVELQFPSL
ncbi:MAG: sensor histidine kinase [Salibacteraceae bacterium]